ncbi:MAG: beta-lactamase family protein, partial [Fimbriimonadaceae bacterium]|nr:beta-lactamase family protein [Fimbriimonadaceae bacterium]
KGLNFPVGEGYNYSNTGYWMAGRIVEKVTGKSLGEAMKAMIFQPLKMDSTQLRDDVTRIIRGRAESYAEGPTGWIRHDESDMTDGDGALLTTVRDMAKWEANLNRNRLGKGRARLLDALAVPTRLKSGTEIPYGIGLMPGTLDGVKQVEHGGNWLGFNAMFSRFPDQGIAVAAFGNDGTLLSTTIAEDVARIALGLPKTPVKADGAPKEQDWREADRAGLEGAWVIKVPGGVSLPVKFDRKDRGMTMSPQGQPTLDLYSAGEGEAFLKVVEARLKATKKDASGRWQEADFEQKVGGTWLKMTMVRAEPYAPTSEELEAIVGRWNAPELGVELIFTREGETLKARLSNSPSEETAAGAFQSRDELTFSGLKLRIERAEDGSIRQMRMDAGRANGMILLKL